MGMFSWWYGAGWKRVGQILIEKLASTEDFFSIDILLKSFFAPFKQISSSSSRGGNLQVKIQELFDRLFSRFFGAIIRTFIILVGVGWILLQAIFGLLVLIVWPVMPFLPIVGIILMFVVGAPWSH